MTKHLFIVILFFVCICQKIYGQFSIKTNLDSACFQMKVKSLDDFIGRFNFERDHLGNAVIYSDSLRSVRVGMLRSLFDDNLLAAADSQQITVIRQFIDTVIMGKAGAGFNYDSPGWHAEATCPAQFKNQATTLTFLIHPAKIADGSYRWEIFDTEGPFLLFGTRDPKAAAGPVSHNLRFLDISKLTDSNPEKFISLINREFKPDKLSVVAFLISSRQLKIQPFTKIEFIVSQIPGFTFRIGEVRRAGSNSGWLITSIIKN
jgi:hypothetical protein